MEKITVQEYVEMVQSNLSTKEVITRKYVPVEEKNTIITNLVESILGKYEDGVRIDGEYDLEQNAIYDEVFIKTAIVEAYTNVDTSDRALVYDTLSEDNFMDKLQEEIGQDVIKFEDWFYDRKAQKVEYLMSIIKSPLDELLGEISTIVKKFSSTFNMDDIATLLPQLAEIGKTGLDQEQLVNAIIKSMPKDHKKPKAKTKAKAKTVEVE